MAKERIDRRVQRTKKLLSEALLELCLEKPYDKITVQDILDRGNFGRSTFYSHYSDKDDLLLSRLDEEGFMDFKPGHSGGKMGEGMEDSLSTLNLFEHVRENRHLFKILMGGKGIDLVHKAGYERLKESFSKQVDLHFPDEIKRSPLGHLIPSYLASALLRTVIWYIEKDMPYEPERMDEIFQHLAVPGVKRLVEAETSDLSF